MKRRRFLRKLHRQIGIFAALWLLVLAVSGMLLQHSSDWGLDKKYITNNIILKQYGIAKKYMAFDFNNNYLVQIDDSLLINNAEQYFPEQIKQTGIYKNKWIINTTTNQSWFNYQGQLLQTFDELGPSPLEIDEINWLNQSKNRTLKQQAISRISTHFLSIEKLVFDIHTGITTTSLVNDFAAIALIVLSLSGIVMYFKKSKNAKIMTKP